MARTGQTKSYPGSAQVQKLRPISNPSPTRGARAQMGFLSIFQDFLSLVKANQSLNYRHYLSGTGFGISITYFKPNSNIREPKFQIQARTSPKACCWAWSSLGQSWFQLGLARSMSNPTFRALCLAKGSTTQWSPGNCTIRVQPLVSLCFLYLFHFQYFYFRTG